MSEIANDHDHIERMAADAGLRERVRRLWLDFVKYRYTYNFTWLGRPIIQVPEDMVAIQELIWRVRPQLVIETGIAHGGGLVLHASILELIGAGEVLGIDIDIREHNRAEIEAHPLAHRITMLEGSSVAEELLGEVRRIAAGMSPVMVVLDSNHTHEHVLAELEAYGPLVGEGSYLIVLDTAIEDLPEGLYPDRPWGKTSNPKTAVWEFLKAHDEFAIDREFEDKLLLSIAPDGYLKRVRG